MNRKKNILFVISTLTNGGAERVVSTLSRHLSDNNIKCSVLLNSQSEDDYEFCGEIMTLGMKPRIKKTLPYQLVAACKRYKKLKKLKKIGAYDAVISFMESANFLNVITGGDNCKVILSVRNVLSEEYQGGGLPRIILAAARKLYKKADCVVAISNSCRRDLVNKIGSPADKTLTIYNGYDLSKVIKKKNIGKTHFITMGRLSHQKGQWHLIRAFHEVVKAHPEAKLQMLGQGPLESTLRELIAAYELADSVELAGFVNNPTDYLRSADCFVFPSLYEGLANAVIEALMNGLPVIAADYTVAREILAPALESDCVVTSVLECQYGILTPLNSPVVYGAAQPLDEAEKMLADAMIGFMEGRIGNKYDDSNRIECLERFSIERAVGEWERIIGA